MKRTIPQILAILLACLMISGCVAKKEIATADAETPEPTAEAVVTPTPEPTATPTPTPEPTPSINLNSFPFMGVTLHLDIISDDPTEEGAEVLESYAEENTASGRFVVMAFSVVDGTIPLDDIENYSSFIALTGGGDGFTSLGYNVYNIGFNAETIEFYWEEEQTGFRIIFDIPSELALTDLQLEVISDESVRLPIKNWTGFEADAASAESAENEVDNEGMAESIRYGESIDGMKPGVTTSSIRSILGGEDDVPAIEMEDMQMYYISQGYIFNYSNSTKTVTCVSAFSPAAGMTALGVGVGSTYEEVQSAYAGCINPELSDDETIVVGTEDVALTFNFTDGVVNVVSLSY